jgi:WD40 repeat protein
VTNHNHLSEILERILKGNQTEADIEELRRSLKIADGVVQSVSQTGKFNTNIGQITGGDVHIGDRIYQGTDAETLRQVLREVLPQPDEKPPTNLTGADGLGELSATVPQRPLSFLPRPEEINSLKKLVVGESNQIVALTSTRRMVGLQGMGGLGKSTLAAELARDEEVRRRFCHGIVWVTLGQTPILINLQASIVGALTGEPTQFKDVQEGKIFLGNLLKGKACLLILDDIWDLKHAEAFTGLGETSHILITTRNAEIIQKLGSQEYPLGLLSNEQALELLAQASEQAVKTLPSEAKAVVEECKNLPLALAMVGAMAKGKPNLWGGLLKRLKNADLEKIKQQFPEYPYPDLLRAIQVSVDALEPEIKERYLNFAVFPEDTPIPVGVLQTFWEPEGLDELDVDEIVTTLVNRSLAQKDQSGRLSLHDLQLDYVRKQANNLPALHGQLLQAYESKCADGWATGPKDGYFFEQLGYHLLQANRREEFRQLLLEFNWLQAKLEATNASSLIADFYTFPEDEELRLVQQAILLSLQAIAKDPKQLWSQLYGRLMSQEMPGIKTMLEHPPQTSWLRPLTPSLHQAGGLLRCTLEGHEDSVNAVAITPDRRSAVSASDDNTLRVWDLNSGLCLHTLEGHEDSVFALAINPDRCSAVSASRDKTLRVWDLNSGLCLHTLEGHEDRINAVAITPDRRSAVSASNDNTLRVWDLNSGLCLHTLEGHEDWVYAVVITPDERSAVSTSADKTLKVWDLNSGRCLHTLGHESWVDAVAINPDGCSAVSASADNTLRVWDLNSGRCLHTLEGHEDRINAVAITPDGRSAVSASADNTLRVWDLNSGLCLHTLGHESWVYAVAITPDGRSAVSASADTTLKVWDLNTGLCLHTLEGHKELVYAVVITPDGRSAVSASADTTLRVWDFNSGHCLHILEGHEHWVDAVAISPDGRSAVSASRDKTLRVWDFNSECCLHTLRHESWVDVVAISPDGRSAVSASRDKTLRVWDFNSGHCLHILEGHEHWVDAVAITPDGRSAVSASADTTLRVWDLNSGCCLYTLGHKDMVDAVAITPDGRSAVSASHDKTLKVWDLNSGRCLHTLWHEHWVNAVAITPDGRSAVSASDNTLRVWDLNSGRCLYILGHESWVDAVAITPDGRSAVSASRDYTLRVWDLNSGCCLHTLEGHKDMVDAVAITPDGRSAVSASHDKTLRVWDLNSGHCLHTLEGHKDRVNAVAITPDGCSAVSASDDDTLRVWDLNSGRCLHIWTGDSAIRCCAASSDGVTFVAGEQSGRVHFLRWEGLN